MSGEGPWGLAARQGARLAALGLLATALVGAWQAWGLERWSFDGPGPGLFPSLVVGVFVVLAVVVTIWPGRAGATEDGDTDEIDAAERARTRQTFALYALSLVVLALGAATVGFTLTCLAVAVLIIRGAERRSWTTAIVYGLVAALIGLVGFGMLLRVDLPTGPIEDRFFSIVRRTG